MDKRSKCNFCGKDTQLQLSHIIPKFVSRWAKDTSPGFFRNTKNHNVREIWGHFPYLCLTICDDDQGRYWFMDNYEMACRGQVANWLSVDGGKGVIRGHNTH
jgi:hypothetical protein